MKECPRFRKILRVGFIFIALYVGSYVGLSLGGRYAPAAIGSAGPKFYFWFPKGFAQGRVGYWMVDFYSPIWAFDRWLWHSADGRHEDFGDYPVTHDYGWGPLE